MMMENFRSQEEGSVEGGERAFAWRKVIGVRWSLKSDLPAGKKEGVRSMPWRVCGGEPAWTWVG